MSRTIRKVSWVACALAAIGCSAGVGTDGDFAQEEAGSESQALCVEQRLTVVSATASSIELSTTPASAAVDGNTGTRWSSAFSDPQWIQLDLGASKHISRVVLSWEAAASRNYDIQVSDDGTSWRTIYNDSAGDGGIDDVRNLNGNGRYVRIYSRSRTTQWGVSLWEVEVYGDNSTTCAAPPSCTANRLTGSSATASSLENATFPAGNAVDNNTSTRWSSAFSDPQWLRIDLGAARYMSRVVLRWEAAASRNYELQVSDDGNNWRTIYTDTAGNGGVDDIGQLAATGRYLRVYSSSRTTQYGVSLYEVEVYGDQNPACATAPANPDLVESSILTRWSANSADAPPATNQLSVLTGSQAFLGQNALRWNSTSGFDAWARYTAPTPIDTTGKDELRFAIRALNTTPIGWQENGPAVVLTDSSGATLRYTPVSQQLATDGASWRSYRMPLAGDTSWTRSAGSFNFAAVTGIELHVDTWDSGFQVDIDGVRFITSGATCSGGAAPITVTASSRASTATLSWTAVAGSRGYAVYRRAGSGPLSFVNRAFGPSFSDSGLALGTSYTYEVRALSGIDECVSASGTASTTTRSSSAGLTRVPTLEVLVPIYTGDAPSYTAAEIASMKSGIELGRQFYYRNTNGKLNLNLTYLEIAAPTPSTDGPTMVNIDANLSSLGVVADEFDAVYAIGRTLAGCYGGFTLLGRTAGSFGTVCGVDYPTNDSSINTTMSWVFTHEFQHALDLAILKAPGDDMVHGHPDFVYGDTTYTGPLLDAGEHYDWEAMTLRRFPGYDRLATPHNGYIEIDDADGDGLAAADSRMPTDEQRFGSNASVADSDADGLNDLAEYCAGLFAGANPNNVDSDGDGQRDNVDPTPRAAIAGSITAKTPVIDGVRDSGYTLYRSGLEFSNVAGFSATSYFAYDANNLYLFIEQSQPSSILLLVDGSGASGFWDGDNTYSFSIEQALSSVQNHTSRHGTEEAGSSISGSSVFVRNAGGINYVEARIPRANLGQGFGWTGGTTTGFSTAVGTKLGIRLVFSQIGGAGSLFGLPKAYQNELWHFDDIDLR